MMGLLKHLGARELQKRRDHPRRSESMPAEDDAARVGRRLAVYLVGGHPLPIEVCPYPLAQYGDELWGVHQMEARLRREQCERCRRCVVEGVRDPEGVVLYIWGQRRNQLVASERDPPGKCILSFD